MKLPDEIRNLCEALLKGLKKVLGDNLYGVYLYGALAFPEGGATGDIDFHVILKEELDQKEKSNLKELHAALARDFPPLGAELDGYYILLDDARRPSPPKHQILDDVYDHSWALHREHIRAGRCIVLYGPDPKLIYPAASWQELEDALRGEMEYVKNHLNECPDYCILNLCRLMYSFETHDVVISKIASAKWASDAFPQWRRHIKLAEKSYARQATDQDKQFMRNELGSLYHFALERIQESQLNGEPDKSL